MRCFVARESSEAVLSSQLGRTAAGRARGNIGTRPTRMGTRLHGMASRAEEIELNRGRSRKNLVGGTDGSNLVPSSGESVANLFERETSLRRQRCRFAACRPDVQTGAGSVALG